MDKSFGPIRFEYDRTEGLKRKPKLITISSSLLLYIVLVYGILGPSITNIIISMISTTIFCIGLKRWFKYKESKENLQKLE